MKLVNLTYLVVACGQTVSAFDLSSANGTLVYSVSTLQSITAMELLRDDVVALGLITSTLEKWQLSDRRLLARMELPSLASVSSLKLVNLNGQYMLAVGLHTSASVLIVNITTWQSMSTIKVTSDSSIGILCMELVRNNSVLVVTSSDGFLTLWKYAFNLDDV